MSIIEIDGSHFTWECATCGTASSLFLRLALAVAGYESHMDSHTAWDDDIAAGIDPAECFTRAMGRRVAA